MQRVPTTPSVYYHRYVLGNNSDMAIDSTRRTGETPDEKVARNPQMSREYLRRASAMIDDALANACIVRTDALNAYERT